MVVQDKSKNRDIQAPMAHPNLSENLSLGRISRTNVARWPARAA